MGKRCGCNGECSCTYIAGRKILRTGEGTAANPYVFALANGSGSHLLTTDSTTIDLTLTGTGESATPYVLSMATIDGPRPLARSIYLTPGTFEWKAPGIAALVNVVVIGGGQGGQSGMTPLQSTSYSNGGTGGAGGGRSSSFFHLPSTVTKAVVTVGAGGTGTDAGTTRTPPYQLLGQPGGVSKVIFYTAAGVRVAELSAGGGSSFAAGGLFGPYGHWYGQYPKTWPTVPGTTSASSGTAGGSGGRTSPYVAPQAPGSHTALHSTTLSLQIGLGMRGGTGGLGGVTGVDGRPGNPGNQPGGGGGGGGGSGVPVLEGSTVTNLFPGQGGGMGGTGGAGGVWITIL